MRAGKGFWARSSGYRLDVLVHMEKVGGIVFVLDLDQSFVVVPVRGLNSVLALIHHHVYVSTASRMRMEFLPIGFGPGDHSLIVGRIGINPDHHFTPVSVPIAECRISLANSVWCPTDRV